MNNNKTQYKDYELSKQSPNPKTRWFNGHFITAKELQEVMK